MSEPTVDVLAAAKDSIVVANALRDPSYCPYCMRCSGFDRMRKVGLLHWRHHCGAEHDEAEARAALARVGGAK
ncbi:hypothetical protein [Lysobacter enzymogenes]|uniref:hypothetical protein n=1 Tax=Lysobacter enzymogenes TaxID=69 RepID=UPI00089A33D1|nr:hypothetical protein [Lysobacter enzymogenes]SDW93918.1 hypothetical protein SAMN05421681_103281 [Lysobacter enzymogenes]